MAGSTGAADTVLMDARAVEDAANRLGELRREELEELGLGALALAAAVAAAYVFPDLALPLFLGGVFVGARGVVALWRRWDLVERLSGERDAYVISEVRERASREASLDRRRSFAVTIRTWMQAPGSELEERVALARPELEALVADLEDPELTLDPVAAVACFRLLSDVTGSPLLNPQLPAEDLRRRVQRIRSGFEPAVPAERARHGVSRDAPGRRRLAG
jgi:hypothetical protein